MLKKLKWTPFAILLWLLTNGCATPQPPDVFVFENMEQRFTTDPKTGHTILTPSPACEAAIGEMSCGHGVSILTGAEVFVGENSNHLFKNKKWSELRAESVYVPAVESYAPLSTYIINSCNKMGCNTQVDQFTIKLDSLNGVLGAIQNP